MLNNKQSVWFFIVHFFVIVTFLNSTTFVWAIDSNTLPTNGQIVGGAGSIAQNGNTMTVTQNTDSMIANWSTFNIGKDATVNFVQPGASSIALNRIQDSQPSQILGRLSANGQIFLLNTNGIIFGAGAQVNVGGLVASSLNLSNENFLAKKFDFDNSGSAGDILNQGNIQTSSGGYVAFISPVIKNEGNIIADNGKVFLTSADKVNLDFTGDKLVNFTIDQGTINSLIENKGLIKVDNGTVIMTARAADELAQSVINNSGVIEAKGIAQKGGRIVLDAQSGQVQVSGSLDVSSAVSDGGNIDITADKINVEFSSLLKANADNIGKGGRIFIWSDVKNALSKTNVFGDLQARGGVNGGDGGFIETSGHAVDVTGARISAMAYDGEAGLWLLDPTNYTIDAAAASTIVTALQGGTNSTISTNSGGGDLGNISVTNEIDKASGNTDVTLTLIADNNISVDAAIKNTGGSGKLNVVLDADNTSDVGDGAGIILLNEDIITAGGYLSFGTGRTALINNVTTYVGGDVYIAGSDAVNLLTSNGAINIYGETIVANTNGLVINSGNGNVRFYGILNSGNSYARVTNWCDAQGNINWNWTEAILDAAVGTGAAVGDKYLATITSRLENAIASSKALYSAAWLGARRLTGEGTNAVWRWVSGPEGLEDDHGRLFFTQNSGSSGGSAYYSGAYSNWSNSEPNNYNNTPNWPLSSEYESVLQFTGNLGKWNDLNKDTTTADYRLPYIQETNLAPSPVTINAGSGTVTFSGAVGANKVLRSLAVTAQNTLISGGSVTVGMSSYGGTQSYSGNIQLGSASTTLTSYDTPTAFTLNSSKTITNEHTTDASLTIKTTAPIILDTSSSISSSGGKKLNLVLWSDIDANGGGILMKNNSSIATNGGHLWMGGGSGTASWNSLTVGDGYALNSSFGLGDAALDSSGLVIGTSGPSGVSVSTSGGDIAMFGKTTSATNNNHWGIYVNGGTTINSGAGKIAITSVNQGGGNSWTTGIEFGTSSTQITSASSASNAITISGDASAATSTAGNAGIIVKASTTLSATAGGGINLTGTSNAGGPAGFKYDIYLEDSTSILANSGTVALTATTAQGITSVGNLSVGYKAASAVTASTSNITLTTDKLTLDSTDRIQSSGALVVKPYTATTIGISAGAGTLSLPASYFSTNFTNGFSGITIGASNSGNMTIGGATTLNDSTTLITNGNIAINAALNGSGQTLTLTAGNAATVSGSGNIIVGSLLLNGSGANYTLNTATANDVDTIAATGIGNLVFLDNDDLAVGTVGATNGINASGTINLATASGDLTLAKSIVTTDTTSGAVVLNAGKTASAGTATGGNIIATGSPTITVGANGRATLYTGSVSGSTGLTTLIGSGSGKFRYNSDESAANYDTTLGSGNYAIYREAQTVTITANNYSKIYDGLAYSGGNGVTGNFVNGDTVAQLGGTLSYGGTAQGAKDKGSYNIIPSGYSRGVGYSISYANGTLTINSNTSIDTTIGTVTTGINSFQPAVNGTQQSSYMLGGDPMVLPIGPGVGSVSMTNLLNTNFVTQIFDLPQLEFKGVKK